MKSSFCLNVRIHYCAKLHFSTIVTGTVALLMKAKIVNIIIVFNFYTILRRCNYFTLTLAGELMW